MMVPPTTPHIDPTAPLYRWTGTGFRTYLSKEDCEVALDQRREFIRREGGPPTAYQDWSLGQCVSKDDPRLKPN